MHSGYALEKKKSESGKQADRHSGWLSLCLLFVLAGVLLTLLSGCGPKSREEWVELTLEGGSGRASVVSPALATYDGSDWYLRLEWNSSNYDYMIVDGTRYEPLEQEEGEHSLFEICLPKEKGGFPEQVSITADTTAMGTPHEIQYILHLKAGHGGETGQDQTEESRDRSDTPLTGADSREISKALVYDHSMQLDYATEFSVDYYQDGFTLIRISDGTAYLLNFSGKPAPEDLPAGIAVLEAPVHRIYLAASAVMDMFEAADATGHIVLSGIKEENWVSAEAKTAMSEGRIQYAGKYNAPDYERILSAHCTLAVESTMILHSPDVKEKLESFGIPVLVDRSSYEKHPLGRTEWVKLYGALTGTSDAAEAAFLDQKQHLMDLQQAQTVSQAQTADAGSTVVFFYITSNGTAVVRKPGDYVANMLELAGGTYLFSDLRTEDGGSTSVNLQLEEFYAGAKDADFLIYNSTIDGVLSSVSDLTAKSPLLKEFKAVKAGQVYCTTQNVYQGSMAAGSMIQEFYKMFTAKEKPYEDSAYLFRLRQ